MNLNPKVDSYIHIKLRGIITAREMMEAIKSGASLEDVSDDNDLPKWQALIKIANYTLHSAQVAELQIKHGANTGERHDYLRLIAEEPLIAAIGAFVHEITCGDGLTGATVVSRTAPDKLIPAVCKFGLACFEAVQTRTRKPLLHLESGFQSFTVDQGAQVTHLAVAYMMCGVCGSDALRMAEQEEIRIAKWGKEDDRPFDWQDPYEKESEEDMWD